MLKKKFCSLSKLEKSGSIKKWVNALKDEIIIFIKNRKIFVKSSICPHFGGPILYEINNDRLLCSWHGLEFDFNGKCINDKNFKACLKNYDYEIKDNNIYIIKK